VLSGGNGNDNFRGFLIRAFMMADTSTAVGTFTDNGADQQLRCDGNVSYK